MPTPSFYPNLSTIASVDQLPEELQFIQNGLQNLLDKIYFKNLQYIKSPDGSQGYYNITLISGQELKIDLFNSDFALFLNPGNAGETLIPVTLNYNWPVLGLIKNFNLQNFSYLPADMQDLLHRTANLSDTSLIQTGVITFEGSSEILAFQNLVDKINLAYSLSGPNLISYPSPDEPLEMTEDIRMQIESNLGINDTITELVSKIYVQDTDGKIFRQKLDNFSSAINGENIGDYIKRIIIPRIDASLDINLGLAFPRNILLPLTAPAATGGTPLPEPERAILIFDIGLLQFSTQEGIGFEEELSASLNHPCQIGNTGLGLELTGAKLDLSRKKNIREAEIDGRPQDFMGVYFRTIAVTLPYKWFKDVDQTTARIAGYNILAGTGGLSGTLSLEALGGDNTLWAKLGKFRIGFSEFNIGFRQNSITYSSLKAALEIPKFKSPANANDPLRVDLEGHLYEDGDFSLTASVAGGIEAHLFHFVNFNFLTIELGRQDDNFFLGTSCEVWFDNAIMQKIFGDQKIVLPRVRIYSNGHMEIVGGNSFIPTNLSLHLGPIDMSVTGIYFGSFQQLHNGVQRQYNYFGFDGSISIDPIGIDGKGKGIKYYYTIDDDDKDANGNPLNLPHHSFIRVETIEVDLVIPGSASPSSAIAIIHGALSLPQPGESPEYMGEISIKLPQVHIAGKASMRLQPKSPAFIIDASIDELPAPIPIGPVGIFGFRGLIGFRYVAEKEAVGLVSGVDTWYDYYKYPPKGIHVSKFSGPERTKNYSFPFSIGAGAVLGTSFDNGTAISLRAMLLLSIPTLFLVEGRATILSARLGLTDDKEPPFFAFVAWGDHSLELGIGADFKLPQNSGWIIDLHAQVQAGFFFNNASRWYINFGTKQEPISARILTILTAQSYLMISSKGIETGARVQFDLNKHFGPAKVHIYAYVEIGGHISFERPQIGGYLALGGMIDIEIWIIGVSIGLDAILSVEAAKPFLLYAEIRIKVCVKIIVKKVCKSFTIELKWEKDQTVDRTPIAPLPFDTSNANQDRTLDLVKGVNMLTNEPLALQYFSSVPGESAITAIIPLDTYVDIKTIKGLIPNALDTKIGGHTTGAENFTDLVSPESVSRGGRQLRQVKHTYSIEAIEIKAWNGSQWVDYHPYQAIIQNEVVTNLRIGYWQRSGSQYDTIRLLATNPFSFTESGEPGWFIPEQYGINPSTLFCVTKEEIPHCSNVLNKQIGTIYYPPQQYTAHYINGAYYTLLGGNIYDPSGTGITGLNGDYMKVTDAFNPFGFAKSLSFNNYNQMVIMLPDPSVSIKLQLTTNAAGATVSYYKKLINDTSVTPQYELVNEVYKTAAQLSQLLNYDNTNTPISKVVIAPDEPNAAAINAIMQQIAALFNTTYENGTGIISITEPGDLAAYQALLTQLTALQGQGCSSSTKYFFSDFYGFSDTAIRALYFKDIIKLGEYYFVTAEVSKVADTAGNISSVIFKINGNGVVVAEKIIAGVITGITIKSNELLLTIAKRNALLAGLEVPSLIKLDVTLNQITGIDLDQILNGSFNQLSLIPGTDYAYWFSSNQADRNANVAFSAFANGTRILLINTTTLQILDSVFVDAQVAVKAVVKNDGAAIFISPVNINSQDSTVVTVSLTANNTISITGVYTFNGNPNDIAITQSGEVIITGQSNHTGHFRPFIGIFTTSGLALCNSGDFEYEDLYLNNASLQNGQIAILAYNSYRVFMISIDSSGLSLSGIKEIVTPGVLTGPAIKFHKFVSNPDTKEVYMLSGKPDNYKGEAVTVMDEFLSSCMLNSVAPGPKFAQVVLTVTAVNVSAQNTTTAKITAANIVSVSQYINSTTILCPPVINPVESENCATSLQQICWLTVAQHEYNMTIPGQAAIAQDQQDMVAAMQKTAQPIWRPNTKYYVHFRLKDTVDNGSSQAGIYDYYYGFKTVGPLGHYHNNPLVNYVAPGSSPDQYPLTSLRQYIDYNRSYPNADGNLLQAKPLFYGNSQCKISIFFASAFAYHMLQKWYGYNGMPELTGDIHIAIKDPVSDVIIPYPLPSNWTSETVPLPADGVVWTGDNDPRIPLNIRVLNNMINYINSHSNAIQCTLTIGQPIKPAAYTYGVALTNLAPRKLYTAIVYNAFETASDNVIKSEQVHQFVFQTSRYASFEEQVNSYVLKDDAANEKQAVFKIPLTVTTANITTAWNVIAGVNDPLSTALQTKYADLFDRVTEGILGFKPTDPPVTTEFNLLKDSATNDTIGILVRNPEPFNIPKIPLQEIIETLGVLNQAGQIDTDYKVLFSKDYSQALVMHSSKKIVASGLVFRFKYKIWDGSTYAVQSTIVTPQILINI